MLFAGPALPLLLQEENSPGNIGEKPSSAGISAANPGSSHFSAWRSRETDPFPIPEFIVDLETVL